MADLTLMIQRVIVLNPYDDHSMRERVHIFITKALYLNRWQLSVSHPYRMGYPKGSPIQES